MLFTLPTKVSLSCAKLRKNILFKINASDDDNVKLVYHSDDKLIFDAIENCKRQVKEAKVFGYTKCNKIITTGWYVQRSCRNQLILLQVVDHGLVTMPFGRSYISPKTKLNDHFVPESVGNNILAFRNQHCQYLVKAPCSIHFDTHEELSQYIQTNTHNCCLWLLGGDATYLPDGYRNKGFLALTNKGNCRINFERFELQYVAVEEFVPVTEVVAHYRNSVTLIIGGKTVTVKGRYIVEPTALPNSLIRILRSNNNHYHKFPLVLDQLVKQKVLKVVRP